MSDTAAVFHPAILSEQESKAVMAQAMMLPADLPTMPMTNEVITRHVVILGYAPSSRFAPWNDPNLEIWGLNDQPWTMPRVDVLFELHHPDIIKAEGHWDKLKQLKIPVFMQQKYDDIPTSLAYPLDKLAAEFKIAGTDKPYFTCSASLMLGVAIMSIPRPTTISLFGIDMAQNHEFREQRPSCEFWLGIARGMGIELRVQPQSDLLQARYVYGFEEEKLSAFRQSIAERQKWLNERRAEAQQKEAAAHEEALQYTGAIADIDHVVQRFVW